MKDAQKAQDMEKIVEYLAKRTDKLGKLKAAVRKKESEKRDAQKFADTIVSRATVSSDLGWTFADKYSMNSDGSVGKYIDKLNNIAYNEMTLEQKQMVLAILFAALLYGSYECISDLKEQGADLPYFDTLDQDVLWVRQHIVPALEFLDAGNNAAPINLAFNGWRKKRCDTPGRLKMHMFKLGDYKAFVGYLFRDAERVLVGNAKNTIEPYFVMNYPIQLWDKLQVHSANAFISTLRGYGEQYTIAPAINLWVGRLEDSVDSKIKEADVSMGRKRNKIVEKEAELATLYDILFEQNSAVVQDMLRKKHK